MASETEPTATPVESTPTNVTSNQPLTNGALGDNYAPDEVLVKFQKSISIAAISQCMAAIKASQVSEIKGIGVLVLKISQGSIPGFNRQPSPAPSACNT